ncbi:hypothetical protein CDEST_04569 [Colletotrichum destructivum]|uniref:STE24 endopeptidase n=1 Tax=Colletotrichum destructivum TaxID=34406 RepID=A0AAX4I843_9PEZI|nr:hypothetical protein CDEST_04569 [Colletotrichum destructivum]
MPTPLDNAMKSRSAVLGAYSNPTIARESGAHCVAAFGGLVTAVAVWAIYGGDMFPAGPDPTGAPEDWTREEMRRWLAARNLFPHENDTREELLARVLANMRAPRR